METTQAHFGSTKNILLEDVPIAMKTTSIKEGFPNHSIHKDAKNGKTYFLFIMIARVICQ